MGNKLALTDAGSFQVGKKAYLTVDGAHRVVKKAYLTVDGVHRLAYRAGVEWIKYSCNQVETSRWYQEKTSGGNIGKVYTTRYSTGSSNKSIKYTGYGFTTYGGYSGTGNVSVNVSEWTGYYGVSQTQVVLYTDVSFVSQSGSTYYYDVTFQIIAEALDFATYDYRKGSTSYGSVIADEGAMPEGGALIQGSVSGSYCVANVDGIYYYYERAA